MKSAKLISVFLGLALVAAAFRLAQQQREIDAGKRREASISRQLEQHAAEQAALETRAREGADALAALQGKLALAEEAHANAEKTAEKKPALVAAEFGAVHPDTLKQWLADADDPAVLRRMNLQTRNKMVQRYSELIAQLKLTPEQTDQFTKLLTDKKQAGMDIAVTSYNQGEDPTKDLDQYHALVAAHREQIEGEINALLGDENYARYKEYDLVAGQSNVLNNLQLALQNSAEPLSAEQTERFKDMLLTNNASRITARVITDSREFLSPGQVRTLQDLRAVQQANAQKRNSPVQFLPNAPEIPAPAPTPPTEPAK
jgi:hypothetical protein